MTSREIRQSFLDFFKSKQHKIISGAPVIPFDDPTLLFTNAGMNQFKDVFLGTGTREYTRAADTQKCIRVSGKHNDLEEVGYDTYHHTFFEMLGNWSFGDYYKEEAITWAWELLTDVWKLPKERLWVTVYRTDDEAFKIWETKTDVDKTHILRFDEKDNFWEMGETGPCGPCSEIHINLSDDLTNASLVNAGVPECIEIWNLVFIQYTTFLQDMLTPVWALKESALLCKRKQRTTIPMCSLRLLIRLQSCPDSLTKALLTLSPCVLLPTISAHSHSQLPTALYRAMKDAATFCAESSAVPRATDAN
jgi:alanyl-tRNA synthetase